MGIEERIELLEKKVIEQDKEITYLKEMRRNDFVTPKQLAGIMGCSQNYILTQKAGEKNESKDSCIFNEFRKYIQRG